MAYAAEKPGLQEHRREPAPLLDPRFRRLIGNDKWARLPAAVRARFGKRLAGGAVALYRGKVVECRLSRLGWLLAQLLRPVGAPLPLSAEEDIEALVAVSEDRQGKGQYWNRLYGRRRAKPQLIQSAKRFAGKSGLEEYIGGGIAMALDIEVMPDGLRFVAQDHFISLFGKRCPLPRWMVPGMCAVVHRDLGGGRFEFVLAVRHRLFGELVYQRAEFCDA